MKIQSLMLGAIALGASILTPTAQAHAAACSCPPNESLTLSFESVTIDGVKAAATPDPYRSLVVSLEALPKTSAGAARARLQMSRALDSRTSPSVEVYDAR